MDFFLAVGGDFMGANLDHSFEIFVVLRIFIQLVSFRLFYLRDMRNEITILSVYRVFGNSFHRERDSCRRIDFRWYLLLLKLHWRSGDYLTNRFQLSVRERLLVYRLSCFCWRKAIIRTSIVEFSLLNLFSQNAFIEEHWDLV